MIRSGRVIENSVYSGVSTFATRDFAVFVLIGLSWLVCCHVKIMTLATCFHHVCSVANTKVLVTKVQHKTGNQITSSFNEN